MNKYAFIPSLSVVIDQFMDQKLQRFKNGTSCRFYNKEDSLFYYPYLLISAGHNYDCHPDLAKDMGIKRGEQLLMGDSGGFQIATNVVDPNEFTSEICLKWLEKNSDLFPILDHPPWISNPASNHSDILLTDEIFQEKLDKTIESCKYYKENQSRGETLNVLHGRTKKGIQKWYDGVSDFQFQGWAIGGVKDLINIILDTTILMENGEFEKEEIKYLHIFACGHKNIIKFLIYLQKIFNDMGLNVKVMSDSSSTHTGAGFGTYVGEEWITRHPGRGGSIISNTVDPETIPEDAKMPCLCPACRQYTVKEVHEMFHNGENLHVKEIIGMHNLYVKIRGIKIIQRYINSGVDEMIRRFIGTDLFQTCKLTEDILTSKNPLGRFDQVYPTLRANAVTSVRSQVYDRSENKQSFDDFFED